MARIRQAHRKPTPEQQEKIKKVWVKYKAKPTEAMRNELMEFYLPLVRYNAERVHTKLPDEVDVDDLMSAGIFGLMDAIDAFDMERGVKFETYCAPRIRGAILDELRSMDWVPRLVRSRSSQVNQARGSFEMEHGRRPPTKSSARRSAWIKTSIRRSRKTPARCPRYRSAAMV